MTKNFRTLEIAAQFYDQAIALSLAVHLKDQLVRAASSVSLNLAEGAGRYGRGDQKRFYSYAMGSLRESQAILRLGRVNNSSVLECADKLGAHLYRLIQSAG